MEDHPAVTKSIKAGLEVLVRDTDEPVKMDVVEMIKDKVLNGNGTHIWKFTNRDEKMAEVYSSNSLDREQIVDEFTPIPESPREELLSELSSLSEEENDDAISTIESGPDNEEKELFWGSLLLTRHQDTSNSSSQGSTIPLHSQFPPQAYMPITPSTSIGLLEMSSASPPPPPAQTHHRQLRSRRPEQIQPYTVDRINYNRAKKRGFVPSEDGVDTDLVADRRPKKRRRNTIEISSNEDELEQLSNSSVDDEYEEYDEEAPKISRKIQEKDQTLIKPRPTLKEISNVTSAGTASRWPPQPDQHIIDLEAGESHQAHHENKPKLHINGVSYLRKKNLKGLLPASFITLNKEQIYENQRANRIPEHLQSAPSPSLRGSSSPSSVSGHQDNEEISPLPSPVPDDRTMEVCNDYKDNDSVSSLDLGTNMYTDEDSEQDVESVSYGRSPHRHRNDAESVDYGRSSYRHPNSSPGVDDFIFKKTNNLNSDEDEELPYEDLIDRMNTSTRSAVSESRVSCPIRRASTGNTDRTKPKIRYGSEKRLIKKFSGKSKQSTLSKTFINRRDSTSTLGIRRTQQVSNNRGATRTSHRQSTLHPSINQASKSSQAQKRHWKFITDIDDRTKWVKSLIQHRENEKGTQIQPMPHGVFTVENPANAEFVKELAEEWHSNQRNVATRRLKGRRDMNIDKEHINEPLDNSHEFNQMSPELHSFNYQEQENFTEIINKRTQVSTSESVQYFKEAATMPAPSYETHSPAAPSLVDEHNKAQLAYFFEKNKFFSEDFGSRPLQGNYYFGQTTYIGKGSLRNLVESPHSVSITTLENGDFSDIIFKLRSTFLNFCEEVERFQERETSLIGPPVVEYMKFFEEVSAFIANTCPQMNPTQLKEFRQSLEVECRYLTDRFHLLKKKNPSKKEQNSSMYCYPILRTYWFFVDWSARLQSIEGVPIDNTIAFSVGKQVKQLMATLLDVGSDEIMNSFQSRIHGTTSGDILLGFGDIVAETWTCLVLLLEEASWRSKLRIPASCEVQGESSSLFWDYMKESIDLVKPENIWEKIEYSWQFLFALLPIFRFKVDGGLGSCRSSWGFVNTLLKKAMIIDDRHRDGGKQITLDLVKLPIHQRSIRDTYIRMLFGRCIVLLNQWSWRPDSDTVVILYEFFKGRRLKDLETEYNPSFPNFFYNFTGDIPRYVQGEDTCFHIFLKILFWTLDQQCKQIESSSAENIGREQSKAIRKLVSQLTPTDVITVHTMTVDSDTSLGNYYSLIMLMTHTVPPTIINRTVTRMKSLLRFKDSNATARKLYFEAFTFLGIIYRFHDDSLEPILDSINEKLLIVTTEYNEDEAKRDIPILAPIFNDKGESSSSRNNQLMSPVEKQEWEKRQSERSDLITAGFNSLEIMLSLWLQDSLCPTYPPWAFLGKDVLRLLLNPSKLFPPSIRLVGIRFVNNVLSAWKHVYKAQNSSPRYVTNEIMRSDSQESEFAEYDNFDYDDPKLDQIIKSSSLPDPADAALAHAVNNWVISSLRGLCIPNTKPNHGYEQIYGLNDDLLRTTIECLVNCGYLLGAHPKYEWNTSRIFELNNRSGGLWVTEKNTRVRRNARMTLYSKLLCVDPSLLKNNEQNFINAWFECIVEPKLKFQHDFTNALLNHQSSETVYIFSNLPISESNGKYNTTLDDLRHVRDAMISAVLCNMGSHYKDAKESSSKESGALRKKFREYLRSLLGSMKEIYLELKQLKSSSYQTHVNRAHTIVGDILQHCHELTKMESSPDEILEFRFFFSKEEFPPPPVSYFYDAYRIRSFARSNFLHDQNILNRIISQIMEKFVEAVRKADVTSRRIFDDPIAEVSLALRNSVNSDGDWNPTIAKFREHVCFTLSKVFLTKAETLAIPTLRLLQKVYYELNHVSHISDQVKFLQIETNKQFIFIMRCLYTCERQSSNLSRVILVHLFRYLIDLINLFSNCRVEQRNYYQKNDEWSNLFLHVLRSCVYISIVKLLPPEHNLYHKYLRLFKNGEQKLNEFHSYSNLEAPLKLVMQDYRQSVYDQTIPQVSLDLDLLSQAFGIWKAVIDFDPDSRKLLLEDLPCLCGHFGRLPMARDWLLDLQGWLLDLGPAANETLLALYGSDTTTSTSIPKGYSLLDLSI